MHKVSRIISILIGIGSIFFGSANAHIAQYQGYSQSQFQNISTSQILGLNANQCDDTLNTTIYSGDFGIFVATIKNNDPTYNMFVHNYKIVDTGSYILSNPTIHGSNNGVLVFNQPFLTASSRNRRVYPNEKIRHLTTAEEVGSPAYFQNGSRTFSTPKTIFSAGINSSQQNTSFSNANYRANGYPSTPTFFPNRDFRYRILTLVDFNNNVTNNNSENYVVMVCHNIVIRRCGDGLVETGRETCDDGANNGKPGYCNASCNGYVALPKPICQNVSIIPLPAIINQPLTIKCNTSNGVYYSLNITGASPGLATNNSGVIYTPTVPGSHTVTCTVRDANFQQPATCSQTFNVPSNIPQCLGVSVSPNPANPNQTVNISCSGANANTYNISVTNSGGNVAAFNGALVAPNYTANTSFVPTIPGIYQVNCNVSDNNKSPSYCPTQTVIVGAPIISLDKKQDVGTGLTDNILVVGSGTIITYQIVISNTGNLVRSGLYLQDIMPAGITYNSSFMPGGTISPNIIGGQYVLTSSTFNLGANQSITITITGTVNQITSGGTYTNIAQVRDIPFNNLIAQDQVTAIAQQAPAVIIDKFIINPQLYYQSGNIIVYRINFVNAGASGAFNAVLTDTLPSTVHYLSSSIQGFNPNLTVTNISGQTIISYGPFTLSGMSAGFITITGVVNSNTCNNNTTNIVTFQSSNHPSLIDTASFDCSAIPFIDKQQRIGSSSFTDNVITGNTNQIVDYQILLRNNGSNPTTNAVFSDTLPAGLQYLTSSISIAGNLSVVNVSGGNTLITYSNLTFAPSQTAIVTMSARLISTVSNSTHINYATLQFFNPNITVSDQVVVGVSSPGLCEELESLDGTVILIDEDDDEAEATFVCRTRNNQVANIRIDCGNGDTRSALDDELIYTCEYDEDDIGERYQVQCFVDNVTNFDCQQDVVIDEPFLAYCGDGVRQGYEQCDITRSQYADGRRDGYFVIDRRLDDGHTRAPSRYEGDICRRCSIRDAEEPFVYTPPACFGANTNLSVSKGEILPFRRQMQIDESRLTSGRSCSKPNSIPAQTMKCDFAIYKNQFESPIYTRTTDCNQDSWNDVYFDFFERNFRDVATAFGKYYIPIQSNVKEFGEYKLVLESVEYEYCDEDEDFVDDPVIVERVCEVNFAITQPYFMQRGAFGGTKQATNIDLSKFYTINGDPILSKTDLQNISVQSASNYNGGSQLNTLINQFVTKYTKLAAKVTDNSLNSLFNAGGQVTISKVPGQQIYIFTSNGASRLTLKELNSFSKPFTMIVQNMDLVVEGSITKSNGLFIVQGGKVSFGEPSTNRCASRQVVNGFFITNQGFGITDGGLTINNKFGTPRCNEGGLTIRGGLIGNGLADLVNQRRSHLNHWFRVQNSSEAAIKVERRNEIFDGAAVLIDYNPSIRQSSPPGLSEFNQIINIYKK